jgi:SAM-dependent methyltransferase
MTPELWSLYLSLQTELAYPGEQHFAIDEKAIGEALDFYHWLVGITGRHAPNTLLIGPGGVNEVEALKRAGLGRFKVLTAHAPEAGALSAYEAVVGDMHDMPLPSGSIDLLYASNVMEHALAPYVALMECRRVLKAGGKAYFILPSFAGVEGGKGPFHLHCLTREVWEELLRKTGYALIETKIYPPDSPMSVHVGEELARLGITVNELLTRTREIPKEFVERTGCAHYMCFLCEAVGLSHPHNEILNRLYALKGGPS